MSEAQKVATVTGASQGIGGELASALYGAGYTPDRQRSPEVFKAVLWAGERDWGAREKASVLAGEIVSTRCRSRAVRE